jgi:hypothetical protein
MAVCAKELEKIACAYQVPLTVPVDTVTVPVIVPTVVATTV